MFKNNESRLSVSNSALISSESFLIPMTLAAEARTSEVACHAIKTAYDEVLQFIAKLAASIPGLTSVPLHQSISPRFSRIDLQAVGKDRRFDFTFAVQCVLPKDQDYWGRLKLLCLIFDQFNELAVQFKERKEVSLFLDEARLSQQKDDEDSNRIHPLRKNA